MIQPVYPVTFSSVEVLKISSVVCFNAVFCYCILFWVAKLCMPHLFFTSDLIGSTSLSNIYFSVLCTVFPANAVNYICILVFQIFIWQWLVINRNLNLFFFKLHRLCSNKLKDGC